MKVKAKAEQGIVIANADKDPYDATAVAKDTALHELQPTSTLNFTNWYHNSSTDPADANAGKTCEAVAAADYDTYFVKHTFWIRSSANADLTVSSFGVNGVKTVATAADDLSASLRVGVQFAGDTNAYIFAPVAGFTTGYKVNGAGSVSPVAAETAQASTLTTIPSNQVDGIQTDVYIWFEGEDESCISNNLTANLEELEINIEFGFTPVTPAP